MTSSAAKSSVMSAMSAALEESGVRSSEVGSDSRSVTDIKKCADEATKAFENAQDSWEKALTTKVGGREKKDLAAKRWEGAVQPLFEEVKSRYLELESTSRALSVKEFFVGADAIMAAETQQLCDLADRMAEQQATNEQQQKKRRDAMERLGRGAASGVLPSACPVSVGPQPDALQFIATFLKSIGSGHGDAEMTDLTECKGEKPSAVVRECTVAQASRLSPEMKDVFVSMRCLTITSKGNLGFMDEQQRDFFLKKFGAIQDSPLHAFWVVVQFLKFTQHYAEALEILSMWAVSVPVGEDLPITPGQSAVIEVFGIGSEMFAQYRSAQRGVKATSLGLIKGGALRVMPKVTLLEHKATIKELMINSPMKLLFEATKGAPLPEFAVDVGAGTTTTPAVVSPPPTVLPVAATTAAVVPVVAASVGAAPAAVVQTPNDAMLAQLMAMLTAQSVGRFRRPLDNPQNPSGKRMRFPEKSCSKCNGKGHVDSQCVPSDKATFPGRCDRCYGQGHKRVDCPSETI